MHTRPAGFALAALLAFTAAGQTTTEQVFQLAHTATHQSIQEIATVIRSVAGVRQLSTDAAQRTLTLSATAGQIALAEWLIGKLDQQAGPQIPPVHEYRVPDSADDFVRVFYLVHADTPPKLQEVAMVVRGIADVRQLFTYNPKSALALRGTAAQMALADWMIGQMDRAVGVQGSVAFDYSASGTPESAVQVFYLTHADTPSKLQEIATLVRGTADIRRLFTYNPKVAMMLRGTAAQVALAEWLIGRLDRAAGVQGSVAFDYSASGTSENVVRVFYLTHADSPQKLQEIATRVRSTAQVRRLYINDALRAMSLRGTAAQIAHAARLVEEYGKP